MANMVLPTTTSSEFQEEKDSHTRESSPRLYNKRKCPQCGGILFGMPGGRDAHCNQCGFKDPCCSD